MRDSFGTDVTASAPGSLTAWNTAMAAYLDFSGDPVGTLAAIEDPAFLAGPVFCAAMMVLSGMDPTSAPVTRHLSAAKSAARDIPDPEARHAEAVTLLAAGWFSRAATVWDQILIDRPGDILALKCSHETWFLVGDAPAMRRSTTAALARLDPDHPAFGVAAAQHGFALEETGDYGGAESWGRLALSMAPRDCWALHCLAHVFETQNRHADAMALLSGKQPIWREQNLLSAHIWWHLALRLIEAGDTGDALDLFDRALADVDPDNRFRLTDGTSLLWRLELSGVDVGDRWRVMADAWGRNADVHTNGFLDMHAALAFARCPDAAAADLFFDTQDQAFTGIENENADTFHEVIKPLTAAIRVFADDPNGAATRIAPLLPQLHRMGGSIVQRELVERSYTSALLATGQAADCADWLDPRLDRNPATPWVLRDRAHCAEAMGDLPRATLLRRRADAGFAGFA